MKEASPGYSVHELCSLFQLSESTYYAQLRPKRIKLEERVMLTRIKSIAAETGSTYGRRWMKAALVIEGFKLGIHRTVTLMKQAKVQAIKPSRKHYYPNAGKAHLIAPNLLNRQFEPKQENTHWVGDITYIRTHQGWTISKSPNAELAKAALNHAIRRQQPDTSKLMFHSDQGVQYSAKLFTQHLVRLKITQSMSRRGNCWDNSVMERFFRSLKSERLNHLNFTHHAAVISTVESYLYFYNYKRLHSSVGYITPYKKWQD